MNRAVFFSPTLLAVALSPALLYSDCSPKTGNPNLVSLEVEAGSINRLIGFNNATADYSVWLDGAATITIRGQAEDPGSTISWETGPTEYGTVAIGSGETTIAAPANGATLRVTSTAPGRAYRAFSIAINPTCSGSECDDANPVTADTCVGSTCVFMPQLAEGDPCDVDGVPGVVEGGVCNTVGILLSGLPDDLASDRIPDVRIGDGVAQRDILLDIDGFEWALSQLELEFSPNVTVEQVNALLQAHDMLIVDALENVPIVLVEFPAVASLEALDSLATDLEASPEVDLVRTLTLQHSDVVPFNTPISTTPFSPQPGLLLGNAELFAIDNQLAIRAPAAWNLVPPSGLARPLIAVIDKFGNGPIDKKYVGVKMEGPKGVGNGYYHGYHVVGIIGGKHTKTADLNDDADLVTGILPPPSDPDQPDFVVRTYDEQELAGQSFVITALENQFLRDLKELNGHAVLNTSFGLKARYLTAPLGALFFWKAKLKWYSLRWGIELEDKFLHVTSAGDANSSLEFNSDYTLAAIDGLVSNTLVVQARENTSTEPITPWELWYSSNTLPMYYSTAVVSGVGVDVWSLTDGVGHAGNHSGSSLSTPQVAGLAAFVWSFNPTLTPQEVKQIIEDTAYDPGYAGANVVDAYAAILATDISWGSAPARYQLLGRGDAFNAADLSAFVSAFAAAGGGEYDYSAFDLNGDGRTGGPGVARFDLDMNRDFTSVTTTTEGSTQLMVNEAGGVRDKDILCYYAYSPLYKGDQCARKQILYGVCHNEPTTADCGFCGGQETYLKASNTGYADAFGTSVDISGNTFVVGAPLEDATSDPSENSGAVYVYEKQGPSWTGPDYLKAETISSGQAFGETVAIDGDTIVVGAPYNKAGDGVTTQAGAVYVFERTLGVWLPKTTLRLTPGQLGELFGYSVAIEGDQIVVGAPGHRPVNAPTGRVHVFRKNDDGDWEPAASFIGSNIAGGDGFGSSVALSGDTIAVGAPGEDSSTTGVSTSPPLYYDENASQSGAVYVFRGGGAAWTETHYIKASNTGTDDKFGWSIAIDGDTLAVGAPGEWSANGDPEDNSAFRAGAAYVFERSDDQWSQVAYVKATNAEYGDLFGGGYYSSFGINRVNMVALSGGKLLVGAIGESSAAECLNGDQGNDPGGRVHTGAAYLYRRSGQDWWPDAYIKASNAFASGSDAFFGGAVAIDGSLAIVGANGENSNATGINGDQEDVTPLGPGQNSGAAYVFTLP